jgi:HD superfamily phosphohydrolase
MLKAVYFHRTVRAAGILIVRAMEYARDEIHLTDFRSPGEYLELDDSSVMQGLLSLKGKGDKRLRIAYDFAKRYNNRNLLKCTYEVMFHHKDQFFTNLISRDEVREKIVDDISTESNVDPDYIVIDVPTVPSVPYNPLQTFSSDIPVFQRNSDGSKSLRRLSEVSQLVDALAGYVNIVRVYTLPQHRTKVQNASEKVFGKKPSSIRVSF